MTYSGHNIYYYQDSITKMVKSRPYSTIRGLLFVVLNSIVKNQKCLDILVSRVTHVSLLDYWTKRSRGSKCTFVHDNIRVKKSNATASADITIRYTPEERTEIEKPILIRSTFWICKKVYLCPTSMISKTYTVLNLVLTATRSCQPSTWWYEMIQSG